MPKPVFKVHEAPSRISWTLSMNAEPTLSSLSYNGNTAKMEANGHYFDQHEPPMSRYDSYDGVAYDRTSATSQDGAGTNGVWKPVANGGGHYDDYDYNTPVEERASQRIPLAARARNGVQDEVGQHLLYETALYDSQDYAILSIAEVDALKQEHARLNSRLEAARRKLTLESKVKDAARNLSKLYSMNQKNRPDTPESPSSPRKSRSSLLGSKGRTASGNVQTANGQTLHQAEDELATSSKEVDQLNNVIKGLMERRQDVERKLYTHTSAVLAEQVTRPSKVSGTQLSNSRRTPDDEDEERSLYSPDEFDGIRDILHGGPGSKLQKRGNTQKLQQEHEQHLSEVQGRLEQFNQQLRNVIGEAAQVRGKQLDPDLAVDTQNEDARSRLDSHFARIEYNLRNLQSEQAETGTAQVVNDAVEEQLANVNHQLHNTLLRGSDFQNMETLREPPLTDGHGYESQLQYLEESLRSMEGLLQQQHEELRVARDAQVKISQQSQNISEYETVISGLWDIIQSDIGISRSNSTKGDRDGSISPLPRTPLQEDFSLHAFSSRVQHLYNHSQAAKEQQDILRRQIQQQRDLNGKSDMEKDLQLEELQAAHVQTTRNHEATEEELARVMAQHAKAEGEASESRSELMNVMNEFDQIKRLVETRQQERDELSKELLNHRSNAESLESEVVRLTTELTMAKAELDSAYGSRAERAKESKAAEVDGLNEQLRSESERTKALEQELRAMTTDFQELTRESIELEKEREQLDATIDGLKDRCDSLENQLGDEKIRWMGVKSPGGPQDGSRETTSVSVLRMEFKKMMRESRAEGMKAFRIEQEERRKAEAEVRRLRQAGSPLSVKAHGLGGNLASTPASAI
nr:hypothetical protein CFP56_00561 [Quercus suber]